MFRLSALTFFLFAYTETFATEESDWSKLKVYKQDDWTMWAPIVKKAPKYPKNLFKNGVEGCVNIYFDINKSGHLGQARVVKSIPEGVFDKYALQALRAFKYKASKANPNNTPILTNNIFTFTIESSEKARDGWLVECSKI